MATLTDEQVDIVLADIRGNGIRLEGLRDNLLDHICILLEEKLGEGGDFEQEYAGVIKQFYRKELYELEEEALFLTSIRGPHVVLSRGQFFLGTLILVVSPYLAYIGTWWWILRPAGDLRSLMDVLEFVLVFSLFPLLITLVLFLTPERLDPVIPWRSKILLGFRPIIRVLPETAG